MFAELLLIALVFDAPSSPPSPAPSLDQAVATFADRHRFPVAMLAAVARGSWIVWHEERAWAMAFYTAPETPAISWLELGLKPDAVKPGLAVPRLFLRAGPYRPDGTLKPLDELAVDETEYLFHALFAAYFDLEVNRGASRLRQELRQRAEERLDNIPESVGTSAVYTLSLIDFASHAVALANEIQRSFKRRGEALCAALDHPSTLFALWAKIFADGGYRASYTAPDAAGSWALSPYELSREDKLWLVSEILDGAWTGDPRQDFASYCPPPRAGSS